MSSWIVARFDGYGRRLLAIALFLAPVIFLRSTLDVFNLVKLWVLWISGLTAFWMWFARSVERGTWIPRFPLGYVAAAFVGAYWLSAVFSQNDVMSFLGVYHRYGGWVPISLYALIMISIVGLFWESPGKLSAVARAVALASAVVAAYAVIQAAGQDWISWRTPDGNLPEFPLSTMGNSNFAGGFLAVALAFVVYAALSGTGPKRRFYSGVLALDLLALWLTSSRGAMIGAAAGLASMTFMLRQRVNRWMRWVAASALAAASVLAVLVLWHPGLDKPPAGLGDVQVLRTDTFRIRGYYWAAGWRIFTDHPLLGTGPDTFYANYGRYRLPEDGLELGLAITDKPHNILLEYASNSGILGLGTYLALAGLAAFYAFRRSGETGYAHPALLAAFGSAFIAYLTQGFFSIDVPPLAVMGWVSLGGIAVLADPRLESARAARQAQLAAGPGRGTKKKRRSAPPEREIVEGAPPGSLKARRALQAGTAVLTLVIAAAGTRPLLADIIAKSAETMVGTQLGSDAGKKGSDKTARAIQLYPWEPAYFRNAARHLQKSAAAASDGSRKDVLFQNAKDHLIRAHQLQPNNVFITMDLARLHAAWGRASDPARFDDGDRWWRRAVWVDATNWQVRFNYAAFLNEWGLVSGRPQKLRHSIQLMKGLAPLHPDEPRIWKSIGQSHLALGQKEQARRALERAAAIAPGDAAIMKLLKLAA